MITETVSWFQNVKFITKGIIVCSILLMLRCDIKSCLETIVICHLSRPRRSFLSKKEPGTAADTVIEDMKKVSVVNTIWNLYDSMLNDVNIIVYYYWVFYVSSTLVFCQIRRVTFLSGRLTETGLAAKIQFVVLYILIRYLCRQICWQTYK